MANSVNSGYGQNSSFTNATGPSGMNVAPFLQALLAAENRFLGQKAAAPALAHRRSPFGASQSRPMMSAPSGPAPEAANRASQVREQLAQLQLQQERAKTSALTMRAPLRTSVIGYGSGVAITPDSNAMTGAQRQLHLPGGSHLVPPDNEESSEELDFYRRMMANRGAR